VKFYYNAKCKTYIDETSYLRFRSSPYCSLLHDSKALFTQLEEAKNYILSLCPSKQIVVVGMGGSSLGAKAIYSMLEIENLKFLDELNDFKAKRLFSEINLKDTCFLVISKSGNTSETLTLFDYVKTKFESQSLNIRNNIFTITMENETSKLFSLSKKYDLKNYDFPENLSGRFSVFGLAGLLPLKLAGLNIEEIAKALEEAITNVDEVNLICNVLMESIERLDLAQSFWNYDGRLSHFRAWLRQLISESLGKSSQTNEKYSLPVFVECSGSRDQHSYLQHVLSRPERTLNVVFETQKCPKDNVLFSQQQKESQKLKLYFDKYKIRTLSICMDEFSIKKVCQFLMIWMLAVERVGNYYELDVFQQENIDELKRLNL